MSKFAKRVLVIVVLLPIGLVGIYLGGWVFVALAAIILVLAGKEFVELFQAGGFKPALLIVTGGTLLFALGRAMDGFESAPWMISVLILISMAYHIFTFERGRDQAGSDFALTTAGTLYIGWLGAYLISLRVLPDGMWWVILVLSSVWIADAGAYLIGKNFGKHKITPRLSPKKTWEGYIGGVVVGTLGVAGLAALVHYFSNSGTEITIRNGAILGFVLSTVCILGDLGESMIKRQVGKKDSGTIIPGHGGLFDRIDSWLWAGVIGFYLITTFFI